MTPRKLADLHAAWDDREDGDRRGVGLWFDCPTCPPDKPTRLHIWFANPLDGGPPKAPDEQHGWIRSGSTLADLSVSPSVNCESCGHWHGCIVEGEAR